MPNIDLVTIGASAGGVDALCTVVKGLPADFAAAILVVMHIGESSALPEVLNNCGKLPASFVTDHPVMKRGHIYIAPPHYHLRVVDGKLTLSLGPKENLRRPAIDPLFRSAARLYRKRVVGVILSGALDDGAAGLFAIKSRGGIAIVQDPEDAFQSSMPQQAMRHTKVDYRLPVSKIGPLLLKLVGRRRSKNERLAPPKGIPPSNADLTEGGRPLPVSCPACQGPLFVLKEGKETYTHCRVGHAFSSASLHEAHDEALERSLWTSIRMLGEKIILHKTMELQSKHDPQRARRLRETIDAAQNEIQLLKEIVERI
jgi:two-component system chemotaxis response regulator CheB